MKNQKRWIPEELPGKPESKGEEKVVRNPKKVQSAMERLEALEAETRLVKEEVEKALRQDHEDSKRKLENARKVLNEANDKKEEHEIKCHGY